MLSAFITEFFDKCYSPLGDLMDDIALLNSSVNFIIYYFMSRQFRKTFIETFGLTWCKCPEVRKSNPNGGGNANLHKPGSSNRARGASHPRHHAQHELKPLIAHQNAIAEHGESEPKAKPEGSLPEPEGTEIAKKDSSGLKNSPNAETNGPSPKYVLKRTNEPEEQV